MWSKRTLWWLVLYLIAAAFATMVYFSTVIDHYAVVSANLFLQIEAKKNNSQNPWKFLNKVKTEINSSKSSRNTPNEQIVLLLWYKPFDKKRKEVVLKGCGDCILTDNRTKLIGDGIKVVVIHHSEFNLKDLPKLRKKNHLYGWWTMESTLTHRNSHNLKQLDGIFNLSLTLRRDSDVPFPYGNAAGTYRGINRNKQAKTVEELDAFINKKKHLALWVVSNCNVNKGALDRMKYARRMIAAGLNLTFGGRCSGSKVRQEFNYSKYKFYLAFENSWGCKDYITEKFWKNALGAGTVPVVLGAQKSDYEAVAPPNSFIYAQDYPTPEDLVKYLQYLDRNDKEYRDYFMWQTMDISQMPLYKEQTNFCKLCSLVKGLATGNNNTLGPVSTTLSRHNFSLRSWFIGTENKECFT